LQHIILSHLIENEKYGRKVFPFLKEDYFTDFTDREIFKLIKKYADKYGHFPSKEVLYIDLQNLDTLNESQFKEIRDEISALEVDPATKMKWLIDKTEEFCQDKAIYNAIHESIHIIQGETKKSKNAIPDVLKEALKVSFNTDIGHDYLEDSADRYKMYHEDIYRIPFNLEYMNKITRGGLPGGTLTVFMGGTGTGKSLVMGHMAAYNLMCSHNVLYITMELGSEEIGERVDANLLDIKMDELRDLSKKEYTNKIKKLKDTTKGKFILQRYPQGTVTTNNFRVLIDELRIKKNFIPNIIYIDYLNLVNSYRFAGTVGMYSFIKAVAEELRGLAQELNVPLITATQTNRSGYKASDVDIDNISDSMGTAFTADLMVGLIVTDEIEEMGKILFKQLKSRLGDPAKYRSFFIGLDKEKMRLYDVDNTDDIEDTPIMDNTDFGIQDDERGKKKFDFRKFDGFK
jgi:replicative DNA helicase